MNNEKLLEEYSFLKEVLDTNMVDVPEKLIDQIIGQDEVIETLKIAIDRRRHILLVGVPGVGKSLLAKTIADSLPEIKTEVYVSRNPDMLSRPNIKIIQYTDEEIKAINKIPEKIQLDTVNLEILFQFNFYCKGCNKISNSDLLKCPQCNKFKLQKNSTTENNFYLQGMLKMMGDFGKKEEKENKAPKILDLSFSAEKFNLEPGLYERNGDTLLRYPPICRRYKLNQKLSSQARLLPLNRKKFIHVIGAGENELLGEIKHDPYGGDEKIGTEEYKRVIPGAIHEAHEGVLYIDEISRITHLQKAIYTAMQDKKYPISTAAHGSGSSAKVMDVPCDFLFFASCNISDLHTISKPLRSRISGYGYELFVNSYTKISEKILKGYVQFIAQEIKKGKGSILPFENSAIVEIILEGIKIGQKESGEIDTITLKFRDIAGLILKASDRALFLNKKSVIKEDVVESINKNQKIEQILSEKFGNFSSAKEFEQFGEN